MCLYYYRDTLYCFVVPDSPESLNASIAGFSSILLSWEELECPKHHGVVTGYLIQQDNSHNYSIKQSLSQSWTISGLSPFHKYSFKIAAINEAGIGKFSETTIGMVYYYGNTII